MIRLIALAANIRNEAFYQTTVCIVYAVFVAQCQNPYAGDSAAVLKLQNRQDDM